MGAPPLVAVRVARSVWSSHPTALVTVAGQLAGAPGLVAVTVTAGTLPSVVVQEVGRRAGDAATMANVTAGTGATRGLAAATAAGFADPNIVGVCPRRAPDPAVVVVVAGGRGPVRIKCDGVKCHKSTCKIARGQADQGGEVGVGLALAGFGAAASSHAVNVAVVAGRAVGTDIGVVGAAQDAAAAVRVVEAPPTVLYRPAKAPGVRCTLRMAQRADTAASSGGAPGDVRVPASFALGSASAVR